jgi:hypothetical protein
MFISKVAHLRTYKTSSFQLSISCTFLREMEYIAILYYRES